MPLADNGYYCLHLLISCDGVEVNQGGDTLSVVCNAGGGFTQKGGQLEGQRCLAEPRNRSWVIRT
jgi:hypothetical protein